MWLMGERQKWMMSMNRHAAIYTASDEPQTNKQRLQIALNRSYSQHILRAHTTRPAVGKFN